MNRKNAIKKFIKALTGVEPEGKTFKDIFSNSADAVTNNRLDITTNDYSTYIFSLDYDTINQCFQDGTLILGTFKFTNVMLPIIGVQHAQIASVDSYLFNVVMNKQIVELYYKSNGEYGILTE